MKANKKYTTHKPLFLFLIVTLLHTHIFSIENDVDSISKITNTPTTRELLPDAINSVELPEGIIFGKFTKDDGTLLIKGNVIVPSGQTLELGPGCKVYIGGEYTTITIFGQIIAKGTAEEPVIFMSALKKPNPWDWDRIYCRSKNQSQFDHCIIRHSNYGITVENGSASISNSQFERNSLSGLVVTNSEVTISSSNFTSGHALAINIRNGGIVKADSITIRENISGVACDSFASFELTKGSISRNTNGIIISPKSKVSIVAAEITRNRYGIVSTKEIPRRTREMIFSNGLDVKIVTNNELYSTMKEPQAVKSLASPTTSTIKQTTKDFTPGFTALNTPQEPNASFIGNVITGFSYYKPSSLAHPLDDSVRTQQKYLGEQSDTWYSGLQPEIQLFGNGKRGAVDVNLLIDMYGNDWLSTSKYIRKNMFNLSLSYNPHSVVIGDFFESGTETSVSGRQMTGIRYAGSFLTMGAGMHHINVKIAAGESEIPKDVGDREINIISDTVDTGMSVRQQITYIASATVKPVKNVTVNLKGIIAQDQIDNPFLRDVIEDLEAPDPIRSQTGCLEGTVDIFNNNVTIYSELDLGSHDTISGEDLKNTSWYNPHIEKALPEVFGLFNTNKFTDYYAYTIGTRTAYKGFNFDAGFLQIGQSYFSAGNPYLENDRRSFLLKSEKQFSELLSGSASYEYERTSLSEVPDDYHSVNVASEYQLGENRPTFSADYALQFENSPSTERIKMVDTGYTVGYDDRSVNNMISIEGKQVFKNGVGYSLRYQFMNDNDISDHPDIQREDIGTRFQNQVNGWFSFAIKKIIKNKTTFRVTLKNENRDSLTSMAYKFGNSCNVTIIPRKLSTRIAGEYSSKNDHEFESDTASGFWIDTKNHSIGAEIETKYSITPKLSLVLNGQYEISYDESPASTDNYKLYVVGLHSTWLF